MDGPYVFQRFPPECLPSDPSSFFGLGWGEVKHSAAVVLFERLQVRDCGSVEDFFFSQMSELYLKRLQRVYWLPIR